MPLFSLAPIPGALNKTLPKASTMDLFLVGGGGGFGGLTQGGGGGGGGVNVYLNQVVNSQFSYVVKVGAAGSNTSGSYRGGNGMSSEVYVQAAANVNDTYVYYFAPGGGGGAAEASLVQGSGGGIGGSQTTAAGPGGESSGFGGGGGSAGTGTAALHGYGGGVSPYGVSPGYYLARQSGAAYNGGSSTANTGSATAHLGQTVTYGRGGSVFASVARPAGNGCVRIIWSTTAGVERSFPGDRCGYGFSTGAYSIGSEQLYDTPGTYSWTCPAGVTKVAVVCIGGGGNVTGSGTTSAGGGGGGALAYKNNIIVVPGTQYTVVVGAGDPGTGAGTGPGGASSFTASFGTCTAGGGGGTRTASTAGGTGGVPSGIYDGGAPGGTGGSATTGYAGSGGAGGYYTYGSGGGGGGAGVAFATAGVVTPFGGAGGSGSLSGVNPAPGGGGGGGAGGAISLTSAVSGSQSYTSAGTFSWVVPTGVTSISAVLIGGGSGAYTSTGGGTAGGGGDLRWINSLAVTPGETITVTVGAPGVNGRSISSTAGGFSALNRGGTELIRAGGGTSVNNNTKTSTAIGGNIGGGNGGTGAIGSTHGIGGGGAGGYSGAGGNGGVTDGANGTGGAAGGGGGADQANSQGGNGGNVGIFGEGTSGTGATYAVGSLQGNSGGAGSGSGYGGGSGARNDGIDATGLPVRGAVRIVWGSGRAFPSTSVTTNYDGIGTSGYFGPGTPSNVTGSAGTATRGGDGGWGVGGWDGFWYGCGGGGGASGTAAVNYGQIPPLFNPAGPVVAIANTGTGGGPGGAANPTAGTVIIRYSKQFRNLTITGTAPTTWTDGIYKYYKFTQPSTVIDF